VADCSRLARRQPGKLGRHTSTAAYGAQPETVTRPNAGVDHECDGRTDGQTDGRTETEPPLAIAPSTDPAPIPMPLGNRNRQDMRIKFDW